MTYIITDLKQLEPGDLMFGPIGGAAGVGVGVGQLFLAVAEPVIAFDNPKKWFKVRHTGIVTEAASSAYEETAAYKIGTGPMLVQAMPGGAEKIELNRLDHWNKNYVYIRPSYAQGSMFEPGYENRSQGFKVARAAEGYIDTPYDFATYGAIPVYRRGIQTERIKTIISDTSTMMCSRLVDKCLDDADWHLFDDGRLPGNVTPSEVYRRVLQMPITARTSLGSLGGRR